jgi:hypothetical protein
MKPLAIGFIGAVLTLALAAPSWAQGPVMKAASLTVAGKDSCAGMRHTAKARRIARGTRGGSATASDNSANQLNAQELSRLQGGGAPAPAPAPAPMPPGGNNPTSGTAGPLYNR